MEPRPTVTWYIGPRVRCDLVGYGGVGLTGPRYEVRIHATGSRKGTFRTEELKSLVVLAPVGTRVVLATSASREGWQDHPWRAIRMLADQMFTNDKGQKGVRVPDLDWLDRWDAKRPNPERQESYPVALRLDQGTGYTFGRPGPIELKGHVKAIWVEREDLPITGGQNDLADVREE